MFVSPVAAKFLYENTSETDELWGAITRVESVVLKAVRQMEKLGLQLIVEVRLALA
jgi:hypothetical protein